MEGSDNFKPNTSIKEKILRSSRVCLTKDYTSGYKNRQCISKERELFLFLLIKQPVHKIRIIKGRIPTVMITSYELDIFNAGINSLQCFISFPGTFRCYNRVCITMKIRNLISLSSFPMRTGFTVPQIGTAAAKISG